MTVETIHVVGAQCLRTGRLGRFRAPVGGSHPNSLQFRQAAPQCWHSTLTRTAAG